MLVVDQDSQEPPPLRATLPSRAPKSSGVAVRRSRVVALGVGALLALSPTAGPAVAAATGSPAAVSDRPAGSQVEDRSSALVTLTGAPLTVAPGTRNEAGRVDFSRQATKSAQARLAAVREDFRSWLAANAPTAQIRGQYDLSLNAVTVTLGSTELSTLLTAPQVSAAQYQRLYHPHAAGPGTAATGGTSGAQDPDLSLINAEQAWAAAGTRGDGIKVAVIDSGIDVTHPCFHDTGYAAQRRLGDHRFTNNKVIVARVFNNKATSLGYTPEDFNSHGTHVAGTVGCNEDTPATVDGVPIPYGVSGVAPRALLGNYNVFPGDVGSAREEDILNALEAAYRDGMDIANMSLGSPVHGIQDLLTIAVNNLDDAGMLITASTGNGGPGAYTAGSPGSAQNALTAGASTVPHSLRSTVLVDGTSYDAAVGEFPTVEEELTAPLQVLPGSTNGLDTACTALTTSLSGSIAVLSRGTCTFSTKIRHAQQAGAVAVLVVNNVEGTSFVMAQDGTPDQPHIPAYLMELAAAPALIAADGTAATVTPQRYEVRPGTENLMADFSSHGPVFVSNRIKPDAVAPGADVLSAVPHRSCAAAPCFAFYSGTSMAAPHLAGSVAVLRAAHTGWTTAQVRSAVTNTADRYALRTFDAARRVIDAPSGVQIQGGGLADLQAATHAQAAMTPVSLSAGAVPSISGQTRTVPVTLTNLTATERTWTIDVSDARTTGVTFTPTASSVTVQPGASAQIHVTVAVTRGAPAGSNSAYLTLHEGQREVAHAAIFVLVT